METSTVDLHVSLTYLLLLRLIQDLNEVKNQRWTLWCIQTSLTSRRWWGWQRWNAPICLTFWNKQTNSHIFPQWLTRRKNVQVCKDKFCPWASHSHVVKEVLSPSDKWLPPPLSRATSALVAMETMCYRTSDRTTRKYYHYYSLHSRRWLYMCAACKWSILFWSWYVVPMNTWVLLSLPRCEDQHFLR